MRDAPLDYEIGSYRCQPDLIAEEERRAAPLFYGLLTVIGCLGSFALGCFVGAMWGGA